MGFTESDGKADDVEDDAHNAHVTKPLIVDLSKDRMLFSHTSISNISYHHQ